MEDIKNCPVCRSENRHYICNDSDFGVVEENYYCNHCGYFMEMSYSPIHEGIEMLPINKILHQLVVLFKNRKHIRGLKLGRSHF